MIYYLWSRLPLKQASKPEFYSLPTRYQEFLIFGVLDNFRFIKITTHEKKLL